MYPLTQSKKNLIKSEDNRHFAKFEILRNGVWYNLSNLDGEDRVTRWARSENIDLRVATLRIELAEDDELESLLPGRKDSKYYFSGSPLLRPQRLVRLWTATVAPDAEPKVSDWVLKFEGYLGNDIPVSADRSFSLDIQDKSLRLQDCFITYPRYFGADGGKDRAQVIQDVINAHLPPGHGISLYYFDGSSFNLVTGATNTGTTVVEYRQDAGQTVWEAIQKIADQHGWDLRYKFVPSTGSFELVFWLPNRDKTNVDDRFNSFRDILDDYSVNYGISRLRNTVAVHNPSIGGEAQEIISGACSLVASATYQLNVESARLWDYERGNSVYGSLGIRARINGTPTTGVSYVNPLRGAFRLSSPTGGTVTVDAWHLPMGYTASSVDLITHVDPDGFWEKTFYLSQEDSYLVTEYSNLKDLGDYILHDLNGMRVRNRVSLPYYDYVEVYDLYRIEAPELHDDSIDVAVLELQESGGSNQELWETIITGREELIGSLNRWLLKEQREHNKRRETGLRFSSAQPKPPEINTALTTFILDRVEQMTFSRGLIAWNHDDPRNILTYEIRFRRNGTTAWSIVNTQGIERKVEVLGLTPGQDYDFGVRAFPLVGTPSFWGETRTLAVVQDSTPPAIPSGLTAVTGTGQIVSLSWSANVESDFDEYSVYRSETNNSATATVIAEVRANRFVDVDVVIGTTYYYWVKAWDTSENGSDFSSGTSATPGVITSGEISSAILTAISAAQTTADSKIVTFVQNDAPSASALGDLWIKANDSNKLHRWNGSAWIEIRDSGIGTALTNASNAQNTADSKIITFVQNDPPSAEAIGDLWIKSNDSNKLHRWNGSAWIEIRDSGISAAHTLASSKIVTFVQSGSPTALAEGDLWIKTSDNNKLHYWDGSAWTEVRDGGISTAIGNAAAAQSLAETKIVTFVQGTTPTAFAEGDLWVDTANENILKRWNGSAWVVVQGINPAIPSAPTAASKTGEGSYIASDGTVFSYLTFSVPARPSGSKYQNVLFRVNGGSGWKVADQLSNTSSATVRIDDLTPGISYAVATQAFSPFGIASSTVNATSSPFLAPGDDTLPAEPSAPTLESIVRGVLVKVTTPNTENDLAGYRVHVSTTNGFAVDPTPVSGNLKAFMAAGKGETVQLEVVDLNPGTTYYVRLVAVDHSGNLSSASTQEFKEAGRVSVTDLVTIAPGSALNANPNMDDPSAWVPFSADPAPTFTTISDGQVGNTVARSSGAGVRSWYNEVRRIPLDPSKTYRVRAWMRTVSGSGNTGYMGVALFDSSGTTIAGDGSQWFYVVSATIPGTFTQYSAVFGAGTAKTFPANARTMSPLFILSYDPGGGPHTSIHEIQDLRIEEVLPSELIRNKSIGGDKLRGDLDDAGDYEITADGIRKRDSDVTWQTLFQGALVGLALDGDTLSFPGFVAPPKIILMPSELPTYDKTSNQTQSILVRPENIRIESGVYKADVVCRLMEEGTRIDNTLSPSQNLSVSSSYTTPATDPGSSSTTAVGVSGICTVHIRNNSGFPGPCTVTWTYRIRTRPVGGSWTETTYTQSATSNNPAFSGTNVYLSRNLDHEVLDLSPDNYELQVVYDSISLSNGNWSNLANAISLSAWHHFSDTLLQSGLAYYIGLEGGS